MVGYKARTKMHHIRLDPQNSAENPLKSAESPQKSVKTSHYSRDIKSVSKRSPSKHQKYRNKMPQNIFTAYNIKIDSKGTITSRRPSKESSKTSHILNKDIKSFLSIAQKPKYKPVTQKLSPIERLIRSPKDGWIQESRLPISSPRNKPGNIRSFNGIRTVKEITIRRGSVVVINQDAEQGKLLKDPKKAPKMSKKIQTKGLESILPTKFGMKGGRVDITGEAAYNLSYENGLDSLQSESDIRERVDKPESWPYCVHGRLIMTCDGASYVGSGTVIGCRFVLTAAHNVYSILKEREFDQGSMIFIPAMNGNNTPYGQVKVSTWHYPETFKTTGKEDYALLVLEEDIGQYTGWFGLNSSSPSDLDGKIVSVYGYPTHPDKHSNMHYLWGMEGPVKIESTEDMMEYDIDTSSGQTGSAVWYINNKNYYILGIHVQKSHAIYLNNSRIEKITSWMSIYHTEILESLVGVLDSAKSLHSYLLKVSAADVVPYLTSLDLTYNKLGPQHSLDLSNAILPYLTTLNLTGNILGPQGVKPLSEGHLTSLIHLNLSRNKIGSEGARYLSRGNLSNLNQLDISRNKIESEGAKYLSRGNLVNLNQLDISRNSLGPEGARYLSRGNLVNLKVLDISRNSLGPEGAKEIFKGKFRGLTDLNLSNNKIGDTALKEISTAKLMNLSILDLAKNNIGPRGAKDLSTAPFLNLTVLHLKLNKIRAEGARELAAANLISLTTLDLASNEIGNVGLRYLSTGNLSKVTDLDLTRNGIDHQGVRDLATGNMIQLTKLNLEWNSIGPEGAKELAQGKLIHLKWIHLGVNHIGDEGLTEIAIGNMREIETMILYHNLITIEGARGLVKGNLEKLKSLDFDYNNVKKEGYEEIKKKYGQVLA